LGKWYAIKTLPWPKKDFAEEFNKKGLHLAKKMMKRGNT